jgi:M-phase inducer tyrosine phosphatase
MDVDTSFTFPPKADSSPSIPLTAVSSGSSFQNIFYEPSSPGCAHDDLYESKKRRSASPERTPEPAQGRRRAGTISVFDSSSPAVDSSPSVLKLERIANLSKKPMLSGLGIPSHDNTKYLRKPVLSALVPPSDASQFGRPPPSRDEERTTASQDHNTALPPPRRAFSAMLPEHKLGAHPSGDSPSMRDKDCSPALAYAQRHKVRTIRRRDGTDDFRSLTGATAMVVRDKESPSARMVPQWGVGLGGFGDNEAFGKILPCHRVREDGLMRINCKTVRSHFLIEMTVNNFKHAARRCLGRCLQVTNCLVPGYRLSVRLRVQWRSCLGGDQYQHNHATRRVFP